MKCEYGVARVGENENLLKLLEEFVEPLTLLDKHDNDVKNRKSEDFSEFELFVIEGFERVAMYRL